MWSLRTGPRYPGSRLLLYADLDPAFLCSSGSSSTRFCNTGHPRPLGAYRRSRILGGKILTNQDFLSLGVFGSIPIRIVLLVHPHLTSKMHFHFELFFSLTIILLKIIFSFHEKKCQQGIFTKIIKIFKIYVQFCTPGSGSSSN